jgi:excinuclease ABC subunit C
MKEAAAALHYEEAARLRDQINAIETVRQQQTAVADGEIDIDALGLAQGSRYSCVQVFFVRAGKLTGRDHFILSGGEAVAAGGILPAFIQQYYSRAAYIPGEIALPAVLPQEEAALLSNWLSGLGGRRVEIKYPRRGVKKDLLDLAATNAGALLRAEEERRQQKEKDEAAAVELLAAVLGLARPPGRMDCFDISHIQGAQTVASMVVFKEGAPSKKDYRRYKITSAEGRPDDFQSMREVTWRRYEKYADLPDLVIIDGGKGQLSAALAVIRGLGLEMPVIGLAKHFEEIWREGETAPLRLPPESPALLLLRRIRDEAHRFAVTYHKKLRGRKALVSVLDNIPHIGVRRRQALWRHFGSLADIRAATVEELASAPGMDRRAAEAVARYFELEKQGYH